jgi:uncharacterized protein (TIGR03066 family)
MRYMICAPLVLAFAGLTFAEDKIDPTKLVGKWEDKNPPKEGRVTMEFTKNGNITIIGVYKGVDLRADGTYKVEGNKITMNLDSGTKHEEVITIDKLTDDEFTHTDSEKRTKVFAKVKLK